MRGVRREDAGGAPPLSEEVERILNIMMLGVITILITLLINVLQVHFFKDRGLVLVEIVIVGLLIQVLMKEEGASK